MGGGTMVVEVMHVHVDMHADVTRDMAITRTTFHYNQNPHDL